MDGFLYWRSFYQKKKKLAHVLVASTLSGKYQIEFDTIYL